MAITSGRIAVGLTPTYIDGTDIQPMQLFIHNDDLNSDVWFGGADVSSTNGFRVVKNENLDITLLPGNHLFAVASKPDHYVSWLAQRF